MRGKEDDEAKVKGFRETQMTRKALGRLAPPRQCGQRDVEVADANTNPNPNPWEDRPSRKMYTKLGPAAVAESEQFAFGVNRTRPPECRQFGSLAQLKPLR